MNDNLYDKWKKRFGEPKVSRNSVYMYHIPEFRVKEFLEEEERLYQKESINQISRIAELEREIEELNNELLGLGEYIN